MYLSIRRYPGITSRDEVIKRVETGLIPQLKELPGFIGYYGVDLENGELASVGIYDTKQAADNAGEKVRPWIQENLAEYLPGEPAIHRGEVLFQAAPKSVGKTA